MERQEMETRLRQTLAERADDVTPSPELWERVADATVRRSRWRSPAVWGGIAVAAAAIVVAVVVVPGLLDTPPSVDIADEPPTGSTTPTETDAGPVTGTEGVRVVVGRGGENAIGGEGALVEVDPVTGEDERVLAEGQPGIDAPAYTSMDLRPGGADELAAMVTVEGQWDIRLLDADGSLEQAFVADPVFEEGEEHHVAWSQDGAYLVWTSTPDDGDGTILHLLDVDAWRSSPVVDDPFGARGFAQSFELEDWATQSAELFDVVGVRGDDLLLATSGGFAVLEPTDGCTSDDCTYTETGVLPDGGASSPVDMANSDLNIGTSEAGPQYTLLPTIGLEGPLGLDLKVSGDADLLGSLELPGALSSSNALVDTAWLSASGNRVLVGGGGRAWLLTVDLDAATPTVVDTVELAGGDVVAGAVAVDRQPEPDEPVEATGAARVEIETLTTSPDGNPIDVDLVQLVGLADQRVQDLVNEDLRAVTDELVASFDGFDAAPRDEGPAWELTFRATPAVVDSELLSVEWSGFEYLGGANGTGLWASAVHDLTTGDAVTIDDVLVDGGREAITPALARSLQGTVEGLVDEATLADELAADPSVFEQFTVWPGYLRFHVDEGQLGLPGAAGSPSGDVVLEDLEGLLRPGPVADALRALVRGPDDAEVFRAGTPDAEAGTAAILVTPDEVSGGFVLTGPGFGTVTVPKPDELLEEEVLTSVVVRPGAADGDLEAVSSWFVGDSAIRVLTVVRDGEVVRNEPLPGDQQSRGGGGIAETPDDTPMFATPNGDHLLWLEGAASGDGIRLVAQRWGETGPVGTGSGPLVAGVVARTVVPLPVEDGMTGFRVEAVARDDRGMVVFASTWQPGPEVDRTTSMLRITLPTGIEGGVVSDQAVVSRVELPGVLVGGGVAGTGSVDDAVGLVETEGGLLLVRLADPRVLVELDASDLAGLDTALGPLVAVSRLGPVLRLADGGFRLVTLDGETRELDLPGGTLTFG